LLIRQLLFFDFNKDFELHRLVKKKKSYIYDINKLYIITQILKERNKSKKKEASLKNFKYRNCVNIGKFYYYYFISLPETLLRY
jgi:hypothetical protein